MKGKKLKKISLAIFILAIGIISISFSLHFQNKTEKETTKPAENHESSNENKNLLGEKRTEKNNEITTIIKNEVQKLDNLKTYLKDNNMTRINLQELKEKFNINTTELEKEENGCDLLYTYLEYDSNYENYSISLTCKVLMLN